MKPRAIALLFAFLGLATTSLAATFLQGVEERASRRFRASERLAGQVKTADPSRVDPELEGELVRLEGMAVPEGPLVDPDLGLRTTGLLLYRSVEMWQWLPKAVDGETVYEQGWSDILVSSEGFPEGHENPSDPRMTPRVTTTTVRVGEYVMPDKLVRSIQKLEPVPFPSVETVPEELRPASVEDGVLFLGSDPEAPRIGDIRVRFERVLPLEVRMLGVQEGDTLTHFGDDNNPRFLVLKIEDQPLFPNLDSISPAQIWLYRSAALVGLALGLALLRRAVPRRLRPGFGAVVFLALAAAFGTAAAIWPEVSSVRAWTAGGVAFVCLAAGLILIRRRG